MFRSIRDLRRTLVLGLAPAMLAAIGISTLAVQPAWAAATGGSGASLPYVEVQAENSATNGTVIGPSYAAGQLADEASYRKAVTLQGTGQEVTFTTPVATNSIDFRYSIPDTSGGTAYTAPLSLYINGVKQPDFTLTNATSWYYGSYPFTNDPGSNPHHFYDEAHRLFSTTYPQGTTFKLQVDAGDNASSYTVDFADFEQVGAPLTQPSGSVSVTSEGADPSGAANATSAFNAAIAAAGPGGTVWIPPGTFNIPGHITVNNVTVAGAGMWYSSVNGAEPGFYGLGEPDSCGVGGNSGVSTNVHLSNFAIFGQVGVRNDCDQDNGIGGALSNSSATNIWIDHLKVGAWLDGPMDKLTLSGLRIRDTTADGINFHGGVTNSTVTNSDIRNTGDDGIATWADSGKGADANDTISNNTVQDQILANGIAIYGGHDNTVTGNLVQDTGLAQGGGITVAQRFTSTPVGLTTVSNNTMIRDGSLDPNWQFGVGALWFDGSQGAVTGPVNVTNALIEQSPYEAVQWVEGTVSGVSLNNVTIAGTGTFALQEQTGGAATFTNVTATGVGASSPIYNCEGGNFVVTDGGGNSGITGTPVCGPWPAPVFPPYPVTGVQASPSALNFGSVATGATSAAQTVTVSNPTGSAASVSSIAASGDFSQTNTCGSSIAANGSCTVSVKFAPTATGARSGSLTVNAGGVTNTVSLSGTGTAPGPVLNASPGGLSFASTVVGSTTAAQTVTLTNSGTSTATVSGVSVTGDFSQTNNCSSVAVGASCTVNVAFKPTAGGARSGTLSVASNANNSPTAVGLSGSGIDSSTNIAAGKPASASSSSSPYVAANLTDPDASTYWESANGSFPQWAQVDLGQNFSVGKVVLKLPPATAWSTRTETLSVQGSTDGTNFSTLVGSAGYTFDPNANGNTATITVSPATARYVRVNITANTGWPAGQLSDFEVFPSSGGGGTNPSATLSAGPTSLTFASQALNTASAAQSVTVTNTGTAAAAVSGVATTGDFSQTNTCGTSIAAGASCAVAVKFTPTASGTRTGNLTISSNASNSPTTVALTGTGAGTVSTNLAAGKPTSESSHTDVYPSSNVTDGNQGTYWESANNAFPQWVQVDLGSAQSASRVVLQLPAGWGSRNETLSLTGSTDGSFFSTVKSSAAYTFDPNSNNTVTITFPATTQRYFRVTVTANTGWPAGQLSEFQVWNT
ncbi:choice-of-anchor D domain-containing protein [Streptacidiphilus sp. N1-3]|uniref:Choice-of-anchor D domain-containing protein n=1 Tax=Streptacidiphilus alkalitolerans TaxID=3342712 RepID=A0ABV6WVX4_9ACTN